MMADRNMLFTSIFVVWMMVTTKIVTATYTQGSVAFVGTTPVLTWKLDNTSVAYGTYNDTLASTGWGVLNIKAGYSETQSDDVKTMYAAGYLEGALTAERIYQHYLNIRPVFFSKAKKAIEPKVKKFFNKQEMWMKQMILKNPKDRFWRSVGVIMAQFDGLVDGYSNYPYQNKSLERFAFQTLNGVGDLIDLTLALSPATRPDWSKMTPAEFRDYFVSHGHCSALIKVLGAYENIFMSHSSWFAYASTSRIYKHYNFNLQEVDIATKQMSFSSYPGFLESLDDFYILGNGLVMLQTSINVYNNSLYDTIVPESLPAWFRVRAANMLAHNGKEWSEILARHNSGTYNNEYMILNLNLIHLNQSIDDNALWVVEQMPTVVQSGDQSAILRAGYFPSYNVPFYEDIFNISGYADMVAKFGTDYSYQLAPRAKIFRRDQGKVMSFRDMKRIMRYNDYLHDDYSQMDPCKAICCRDDLNKENPKASGCYDTKVTDYHMAKQLKSEAINGPTLGTALPPFQWSSEFHDVHVGLPEIYNFTFIPMEPQL